LTVLRAYDRWRGRLPDSDRKFVSIFDIVDRKVWLAVGGVFRDATAPVAFIVEGAGVRVRCNACGRQCGKC